MSKKATTKKTTRKVVKKPTENKARIAMRRYINAQRHRLRGYLDRRPHRSFRRTYRRDYRRSLQLPGYISFTAEVFSLLRQHKRLFFGLMVSYSIATIALVGLASQDLFSQLAAVLKETSDGILTGGWGAIGQAGLLMVSGATGTFSAQMTEAQQVYAGLLSIILWMTTVWLLRAIMSGARPKLRDGFYSAGSPLVAMTIIAAIMALQILPAVLGIIVYSAASTTSLLGEGAIAMLVFIGSLLLVVLSAYLLVSSFFAMIIVTLPGMYPWQALRSAGDLVIGRRLRILYRLSWLLLVTGLFWVLVMLPIVLLGTWMQSVAWLAWLPLVPVALVFVTASVMIFSCAYIYLLYRKVVDDDAAPA